MENFSCYHKIELYSTTFNDFIQNIFVPGEITAVEIFFTKTKFAVFLLDYKRNVFQLHKRPKILSKIKKNQKKNCTISS